MGFGSGKNLFRDPGFRVKKAPDPGSGSATLPPMRFIHLYIQPSTVLQGDGLAVAAGWSHLARRLLVQVLCQVKRLSIGPALKLLKQKHFRCLFFLPAKLINFYALLNTFMISSVYGA
jgi:hypothetical protein